MEVHHQPSRKAGERQQFKEYFLEFVMIFLAVTLGFFAETIREGITEHRKAKEFAESMISDVEQDTVQLRAYRKYYNYCANNIDTLQQLLAHGEGNDSPSGKLYWYGLFGGAYRNFISNDETFEQMKSSGSLRYFGKDAANAAAKYDRFRRALQAGEQSQQEIYADVRKFRAQIFDFRYNERANLIAQKKMKDWSNTNYSEIDSFTKTDPPLLSHDRTLLNQYLEMVRSRFLRQVNVAYADSLLKQASVLIGELKREYHLKNE